MLKSNLKFDYYGKEVLGFNERHFWIAGTSEASKKSTPECACFFNPIFHPGYRCMGLYHYVLNDHIYITLTPTRKNFID